MTENRPDLSPAKMATVKDKMLNDSFTAGMNEARGSGSFRAVKQRVRVVCFFEGKQMMTKEWLADDFTQVLPDAMAYVATHLLHGFDTKCVVTVDLADSEEPGTEVETVDAEIVQED
jgi:hypothetical protein